MAKGTLLKGISLTSVSSRLRKPKVDPVAKSRSVFVRGLQRQMDLLNAKKGVKGRSAIVTGPDGEMSLLLRYGNRPIKIGRHNAITAPNKKTMISEIKKLIDATQGGALDNVLKKMATVKRRRGRPKKAA